MTTEVLLSCGTHCDVTERKHKKRRGKGEGTGKGVNSKRSGEGVELLESSLKLSHTSVRIS